MKQGALAVDVVLVVGAFDDADGGTALRDAVTYAQAAEAAGFDGVWIAEHHFIRYGVCPSAMAMAAYCAGRYRPRRERRDRRR